MKQKVWQENEIRLKELILYISERCAGHLKFGATKLNKILYFSDFLAYAHTGEPITGVEYMKLPNGPAPKKLVPIREQMRAAGELGIQEVWLRSGKIQKRTVNLRRPNLSVFTAEQISIVDTVIEALSSANSDEVSDLSHKMVGWKVADAKEVIPYETIFLSTDPPSLADIQRGLEVAKEYGLLTPVLS